MDYFRHKIYRQEIKDAIMGNKDIMKFKNTNIALTGARGLICSIVADMLMYANEALGLNCKVYAVVRNIEAARERFADYLNNDCFRIVKGDVNKDKIEIDDDLDYFIHGASNTHPIDYAQKPIETILTNTQGAYNTLKLASEHNCKKYLFLSSVEIYGENKSGKAFKEEDFGYIDCNTLRAGYPESKRTGESLCQAFKKERNLDFVIARLARCYGAGLLAKDSKAVSQFLSKAAHGEDIVLKSDGSQYYSYLYATDAARAALFLLLNGVSGNAYNVIGKESDITLKELATLIAKTAGQKVVFDMPMETEREGFSKATVAIMDGTKLNKAGFKAKYSVREGIGNTMKILYNSPFEIRQC